MISEESPGPLGSVQGLKSDCFIASETRDILNLKFGDPSELLHSEAVNGIYVWIVASLVCDRAS
jgi:hypothetical protein